MTYLSTLSAWSSWLEYQAYERTHEKDGSTLPS